VDAESYILRVTGDQHDAREGVYRFTGRVDSIAINFTSDSYLSAIPGSDEDAFSGLVNGTVWSSQIIGGRATPVAAPAQVRGDGAWGAGVNGSLNPDGFEFIFQVLRPRFTQYNLRGTRSSDGSPFPVDLTVTNQNGATLRRGTLTGQQVSGPNQGR